MKFSAVIFDLFGTLVEDITGPPYDRATEQMALTLSIAPDDFHTLWFGTVYERNTGYFLTLEDNIRYICQQLGVYVNAEQLSTAAEIRRDLARQSMMSPRPDSIDTLSKLREKKRKIGLISDCSPSEPEIWPNTPLEPMFDSVVFSCLVNIKKPNPQIYQLVADQLNVNCNDCLYVGNGGSNELRGAYEANMFPVLLLPEKDAESYLQPNENVKDFAFRHGMIINSIDKVLMLI